MPVRVVKPKSRLIDCLLSYWAAEHNEALRRETFVLIFRNNTHTRNEMSRITITLDLCYWWLPDSSWWLLCGGDRSTGCPLGGVRTPLEDRIYKEIRSDFRPLNDFIDDTEWFLCPKSALYSRNRQHTVVVQCREKFNPIPAVAQDWRLDKLLYRRASTKLCFSNEIVNDATCSRIWNQRMDSELVIWCCRGRKGRIRRPTVQLQKH